MPIGENWYTGLGSGFGIVASQFLEDGSFVKLREISLGYTFDGAVGPQRARPNESRAPARRRATSRRGRTTAASIRRRTSAAPRWRRRGSTTSTIRRRGRS